MSATNPRGIIVSLMNDGSQIAGGQVAAEESQLLAALRAGDERAFAALVDRYQVPLLRLARMYVQDGPAAEDAVADTWLGLLQALDRFEGRSSLKTYLFRILVNCAKTRARKDRRTIPFSVAFNAESGPGEAAVEPERFCGVGSAHPGQWAWPPGSWVETPERGVLSAETRAVIQRAIGALPGPQREVITLRDVEGFSAAEACNALGVSDTNQRVLLHRARSKVRAALEDYFDKDRA